MRQKWSLLQLLKYCKCLRGKCCYSACIEKNAAKANNSASSILRLLVQELKSCKLWMLKKLLLLAIILLLECYHLKCYSRASYSLPWWLQLILYSFWSTADRQFSIPRTDSTTSLTDLSFSSMLDTSDIIPDSDSWSTTSTSSSTIVLNHWTLRAIEVSMTVTVSLWRFATILDYVIKIGNNGKLEKFSYEFTVMAM